jgi:hypothetical protein
LNTKQKTRKKMSDSEHKISKGFAVKEAKKPFESWEFELRTLGPKVRRIELENDN